LKRSLVFDFDGTIADTLVEGVAIYNKIAAEQGFQTVHPNEIDQFRELETREILRRLQVPRHRVPRLLTTALRRLRRHVSRLPLIEGMTEIIPALHLQPRILGILSSNASENVDTFLGCHGLRNHFAFIHSLGTLRGKARELRTIMKKCQLGPGELLYVGDEIRDLRAAHQAGIEAVAVTWGLNSRASLAREHPAYLLDHPSELLQLP